MALIILIMRQIPKIYTNFSNFLYFLQIRIQNIILTTNELNHYHLFKKMYYESTEWKVHF